MNEIMENDETTYPEIVFFVGDVKYSVNSRFVETISLLHNVFGEHEAGAENRGMIDLNGTVMSLLDMRVIFGLESQKLQEQEFIETIEKGRHAHMNWMTELERFMKERDQFTLAMDGHQCAFGKWFDTYQTDNQYLKRALAKMEKPHLILHQQARIMQEEIDQAKQTGEPVNEGKINVAYAKAEDIYHNQMLPLFDHVVQEYKDVEREMVLVLKQYEKLLGLVVDKISHIGQLEPMADNTQKTMQGNRFAKGVSRDEKGDLVLVLDEEQFADNFGIQPAE